MSRDIILSSTFYTTSTSLTTTQVDQNGNKIYFKPAKFNGVDTILKIVRRSDEDVKKSRHPKYDLLVP
jgi:hypothetical protein